MLGVMKLTLHNTLTRKKEVFTPLDDKNIRMYVCGPTVYDRPHIGNARAVVVYDVLLRLLRHIYGEKHVTYARNITDVDDKIIVAAKERGITIQQLTEEVTAQFHDDMDALNCLRPTHEPRATQYIGKMIAMIEMLIHRGHAYVSEGHVLFAVESFENYGALSGRKLEDLIAGARVEVESYKRHAGDFVLWKPADAEDDESSVFDSPWGKGRPGWHIECSAMSTDLLDDTFDIHGGGADLKFPHHENEIAQSCGANPDSEFAKLWLHNGFLTVNGEKMSKSLGNFITVKDLLDKFTAQGKGHKAGEIIRFVLLSTRYSEPLNWTEKLLEDAEKTLDSWYRILEKENIEPTKIVIPKIKLYDYPSGREKFSPSCPSEEYLFSDLNFSAAIACVVSIASEYQKNPSQLIALQLLDNTKVLGFLFNSPNIWFRGAGADDAVMALINARAEAKRTKNWAESDRIRDELKAQGILLEDKPDGTTDWRRA
jgi:cysteinyl-tRNA synthetase